MAKTSKNTEAVQTDKSEEVVQTQVEADVEATENAETSKAEKEIPANVLALMRLYPHYKEFYVTPNGFVHPAGVPKYLTKGATLYQNKFFTNK